MSLEKKLAKAKLSGGRAATLANNNRFRGAASIGELVKKSMYPAVEAEKNLYILTTKDGSNDWGEIDETRAVARGLSAVMKGQFYYSQYHIIRVCGKTVEYIHSGRSYDALCSARSMAGIIGSEEARSKKSCGGVGRSLIDWICGSDLDQLDPKFEHSMSLPITQVPSWGYFRVQPGDYKYYVHLDVQAYYHSIAKRIKNPIPSIHLHDGRLSWRNAGKAAKRWQVVIETIGANKPLRNTIIGQMCSGSDDPGMDFFVDGSPRPVICRPSKLAAVGHLIVRCGTEMTQKTSKELGSVYTCVDCVIAKDTDYTELGQTYWERCGLAVNRKGTGLARVRNLSNYSIGGGGRKMREDVTQEPYELPDRDTPKLQYHAEVMKI